MKYLTSANIRPESVGYIKKDTGYFGWMLSETFPCTLKGFNEHQTQGDEQIGFNHRVFGIMIDALCPCIFWLTNEILLYFFASSFQFMLNANDLAQNNPATPTRTPEQEAVMQTQKCSKN